METQIEYTSFNANKSVEELVYNVNQYQIHLEYLNKELQFLKFLIESNIFKPQVMNLFEVLTLFDRKIDQAIKTTEVLKSELQKETSILSNKTEYKNLKSNDYFLKQHDVLELKIVNHITEINTFKIEVFQYLRSVIKNI